MPCNLKENIRFAIQTNMFSLRNHNKLKIALKFKYRHSPRSKWWLKDESLIPMVQSVVEAIRDIANNSVPPNIKMFKLNDRKAVFRMKEPHNKWKPFVVKTFLLNHLEDRLKYHRYGLDEVANILEAKNRGISTPEVYGYGHINDVIGLVKGSIIILEDLSDMSTIGTLMHTKSEDECSKIFMHTVPLFVSLYRANFNHIDINTGAVLLCEHKLNSPVFLLDFQHAKFYDLPSAEILMFEAGYFSKSCSNWVSAETISNWLNKIFNAIGINNETEKEKMIEYFNYYFGAELSRKERKAIR